MFSGSCVAMASGCHQQEGGGRERVRLGVDVIGALPVGPLQLGRVPFLSTQLCLHLATPLSCTPLLVVEADSVKGRSWISKDRNQSPNALGAGRDFAKWLRFLVNDV